LTKKKTKKKRKRPKNANDLKVEFHLYFEVKSGFSNAIVANGFGDGLQTWTSCLAVSLDLEQEFKDFVDNQSSSSSGSVLGSKSARRLPSNVGLSLI
jgi:hypothetical protein